MRVLRSSVTFIVVLAALVGCANPCKDLEAKKADCSKAGPAQAGCEAAITAAVQTGNGDACKATMDGLAATLK